MNRFADSPYFLLNDFMKLLVVPSAYTTIEVIPDNVWSDVVFTDVVWVGGVSNIRTSSPFVNTLSSTPTFDENTDDAVLYQSDDIIWNGWFDVSNRTSYQLVYPNQPGPLLRGNNMSIVATGGKYIDVWAKVDSYGFIPVRLAPVYEEPIDKVYFRFDTVELSVLNYDGVATEYDSDGGSCSISGICSDSSQTNQSACLLEGATWYATTQSNMVTCELNGGTWTAGDEPYYDSQYFSYQKQNYTVDSVYTDASALEPDTEIYFRKDSAFHDWLKNENQAHKFYTDKYDLDFVLRNYVNTDKLFIYFGKIYPAAQDEGNLSTRYQIEFNGLKDWIQRALPPNNRKELFIEFLDEYFDKVYGEGYQQLKDIWSLRDAMECNETFLAYVPTFYGIPRYDDIPSWFAVIYREYARDCVWLLKRKGTYASMYMIKDLFCRDSPNFFNVLERWHNDATTSPINIHPFFSDDFTDHIYTGLYGKTQPPASCSLDGYYNQIDCEAAGGTWQVSHIGAGYYWYAKQTTANYPDGYLSTSDERLSPFYRADLDLCNAPLTSEKIMPKQIAENLYKNWEMMRPVNRQAEYNFIYAPVVDLTGKKFSMYPYPNAAQSITYSTANTKFDTDNFIQIISDVSTTWTITHELGTTDVIVTCWDTDFKKMIPDAIQVIDENIVRVTVDKYKPSTGVVVVSKARQAVINPLTFRMYHGFNRLEMIVQIREVDSSNPLQITDKVEYPIEIMSYNYNQMVLSGIQPSPTAEYKGYFKPGLTDQDYINETFGPLDKSIWTFPTIGTLTEGGTCSASEYTDQAACELNSETWTANGEWWWVIEHGYDENAFMTMCYDETNTVVLPSGVDYNYIVNNLPAIKIIWPEQMLGFAAVTHIGDLVSFYGTIPKDGNGALLPLEWRITTETDSTINTFLTEDSPEALTKYTGNDKIEFWDGDSDNKTFVHGTTDSQEEDDLWYYYTFKISDEGLEQLGIKSYDVLDIQLANTRISRVNKQSVSYSSLSGIYKPFGVNLVIHVRMFANPNGIDATLLDHVYIQLEDQDLEFLYA